MTRCMPQRGLRLRAALKRFGRSFGDVSGLSNGPETGDKDSIRFGLGRVFKGKNFESSLPIHGDRVSDEAVSPGEETEAERSNEQPRGSRRPDPTLKGPSDRAETDEPVYKVECKAPGNRLSSNFLAVVFGGSHRVDGNACGAHGLFGSFAFFMGDAYPSHLVLFAFGPRPGR